MIPNNKIILKDIVPALHKAFFVNLLLACYLGSFAACGKSNDTLETPRIQKTSRCIQGNCVNGRGIKLEASGERYEGEWKEGLRHGIGRAHWPDGDSYIGQWMHDHPHGKG
ncbi:MAG: hypothetical protein N2316_12010, partial [Spirochaetes bacterium]|nr:hypothetical protein [Spirochaetota bacterium]